MNDLWNTLHDKARDDRLGLVYQLSKENLGTVNTAVGQTDRVSIPEFTAHGGTRGPMLCSNSIDSVGGNIRTMSAVVKTPTQPQLNST